MQKVDEMTEISPPYWVISQRLYGLYTDYLLMWGLVVETKEKQNFMVTNKFKEIQKLREKLKYQGDYIRNVSGPEFLVFLKNIFCVGINIP